MDALILAGGENSRLKFQKGLIRINGKRLIEKNALLLENYFKSILISTNNPELYFYLGYRIIGDVVRIRGPMTGIFSAFICSDAPSLFVMACDMPSVFRELVHLIKETYTGQDAVIPIFGGKPQPLLGIYSRTVCGTIEGRLKSDNRTMMGLLESIDAYFIEERDVLRIDPEGKSFINLNTPEDLGRVTGGQICLG